MSDDEQPVEPVQELPQPPRPEAADTEPTEPAEQAEQASNVKQLERKKLTLTVLRRLESKVQSLNNRYLALVKDLHESGVHPAQGDPGIRGQLAEGFYHLAQAAPHFDEAKRSIEGAAASLEDALG